MGLTLCRFLPLPLIFVWPKSPIFRKFSSSVLKFVVFLIFFFFYVLRGIASCFKAIMLNCRQPIRWPVFLDPNIEMDFGDFALERVMKARFDLAALCHVTVSSGWSNTADRKVKEDANEADDLVFKVSVRLDQIQADGAIGYVCKRAHVFACRARQPVWSGLDVGGWINAISLYSI